jgi:photosystem II stability/assembly factor-like uncharacterized protein
MPRPPLRQLAALVLAASMSFVALACGADEPAVPSAPSDAGSARADLGHIHALGAVGDDLYVASHNGLFRTEGASPRLRPVGEAGKDVMGFSVLAPDRFVGSGHPGPAEDLPPLLGLIESRDRGRTWTPVSLLGEADFHVLRSAGRFVYGVDATTGALMVSEDRGRRWTKRDLPAPPFDLAVDPADDAHLVAATELGLLASRDRGRTWRPLAVRDAQAGLLAWPATDRLHLAGADGRISASDDGGASFRPVGAVDGEPVALTAAGDALLVALTDNTVMRSTDGGATWTLRAGA